MTKQEYADYQEAVATFMLREGLQNLTADTRGDDGEPCESYFSWRRCDCCKRPEGGNREECYGYNAKTSEAQGPYAVCEDCVYYAEYGRLDDTTMASVRKDDIMRQIAAAQADLDCRALCSDEQPDEDD